MKKLLLTAAVVALSTSAMADEKFYVRADAGVSFMPKASTTFGLTGIAKLKAKRTNHMVANLGAGMYLTDMFRTELDISNHFNAEENFKSKDAVSTNSVKAKFKATSITVKAIADVYNFGYGDVFVGAGLGLTQLSAKGPYNTATAAGVVTPTASYKAKKKNNMNFLVTAGAAFDVAEGVKLDVAYAYNDHGKTKNFKNTAGVTQTGSALRFRTHDVTAGVRIEL